MIHVIPEWFENNPKSIDSMEVMEEFCEMSGNQLGYSRDFINHAWKKHTLKQTTIF